jgi:hypothetical protein
MASWMSSRSRPQAFWVGGKDGPRPMRHIDDWSDDVAGRESELEEAYARNLTRAGLNVRRQVRTSAGIADIVTDDSVIEVKLWLTRSALLSAAGQVTAYAAVLNKPRRVIFGYEAGASGGLTDALRLSGIEIVAWIGMGGPGWVDYPQVDDEGVWDDEDDD